MVVSVPTTAKGDLVIEITKNSSWISVKDKNRKVLAQKEYKQGEVLTFNGNDYALIIGAPGNVRITYKGEAYPLTVDGRVAKFKLPKPIADFTAPARAPPASVIPKCNGCLMAFASKR